MKELFNEAYEMFNKHQNEETMMAKRLYEAIRDFVVEAGGCIQLQKRETSVYRSGTYGKMYVTKLAVCQNMLMAYCEGENYSCWWNKPVEPHFGCFLRFIAITRQLKDETYCPIDNPLKNETPVWCVG